MPGHRSRDDALNASRVIIALAKCGGTGNIGQAVMNVGQRQLVSASDYQHARDGDTLHVSAVQFPRPGVTIVYDVAPDQASAVRRTAFDVFARERTLVAAPICRFPGSGANDGYAWVPAEYVDRD
jgi:hypothetical protein